MFNRGSNSDALLEKHFGLKNLVSPSKREEFDDSDSEEEKIEFEPPPEIKPDILSKTPIIRLTTPIRNKTTRRPETPTDESEYYYEEEKLRIPDRRLIEDISTIMRSPMRSPGRSPGRSPMRSPIQSPVRSPVIDISDEDEINDRIHELINFSGIVEYEKESKKIKDGCREAFKIKYDNLKLNYSDRRIKYPDTKNLNRIHRTYHTYIKEIYVDMNLGQIQLGYIMGLMAIEFVCIKAFGIPMSGFTKMELKRMYRYNQLMIELGESFYESSGMGGGSGGPKTSLEWRMFTSFGWNVVIFLGLKFLSKYIGGESMTDMVRGAVDKLLDNPVTIDNIENGSAPDTGGVTEEGSDSGIGSLFEGILGGGKGGGGGGGGGDIIEMITNMGTNFTKKMEKSNTEKKTKGTQPKKKRFIFTE